MSARLEADVVIQQGTQYHIFVSHSTTTHIALYPLEYGSPVMKFIEILVHSFHGMESDHQTAAGHCRKVWLRSQV
jgi:carbohydrate-binding DOMON domain-containing protein